MKRLYNGNVLPLPNSSFLIPKKISQTAQRIKFFCMLHPIFMHYNE